MIEMNPGDLKKRTKEYALRVIQFVQELPKNKVADVMGRQLLRSATSVGANYRSACRARSKADFASKVGIAEEEADESAYWLELFIDAKPSMAASATQLLKEANELAAILSASEQTARGLSRG